jgi:hypothetical protein
MKKFILLFLFLCSSAQATDLVLGFTANQGQYASVGGLAYYHRFQADSSGTADSVRAYMANATVNDSVWFAIYTDSSGWPGHTLWILQPDTCFVTSASGQWWHGTANNSVGLSLVAGTWYWIGIASKSGNNFRLYQTTGTTAADSCYYVYANFSGTWLTPPSGFGGYSTQRIKANIALYYHTAGGGPGPGGGSGNRVITIINRP